MGPVSASPRATVTHFVQVEPRTNRRIGARWIASPLVAALCVAAIVLLERLVGVRSPVFAFNLHMILMTGAAVVDKLVDPKLAGPYFDVSAWEPRVYRRLGVDVFMRILQRIGWTAAVRQRKDFDGTRATLAEYERATRHGENAHAWLLVIALALAVWAIARSYHDAAFWIGSMSVLFHVYPILLQRTQRARLTALIARVGTARHRERGGPEPTSGTRRA